ncbi:hypothetical protein M1N17_00635 [Dehalococcoidia bacterium]|nr:hypothetical protein [Dehalococcoidia bacterium]
MADTIDGYWHGWIIDNLGSERVAVLDKIEQAINDKNIPMHGNRDKDKGVEVKSGKVDMWWRRDTPELKIKSEMDGVVNARVATQDYGTSLWVHVWLERKDEKMFFGDNWAKRMHWAAFQLTLERTVREELHKIAGENAILDVADPRESMTSKD